MAEALPPPLPSVRREALLRGPLILTAISRVLLIPFFAFCAVKASADLKIFYIHRLAYYQSWYVVDLVALAVSMWTFLLFDLLLTWLFITRRRMFRPLMTYFSILPLIFLVGVGVHTSHFKHRPRPHSSSRLNDDLIAGGLLSAMVTWPFYYGFSPRVKRVFDR